MFGKLELTRMAQALASHAGARQEVVARNVAQADSPGYRAQDLSPFAETYRSASENGLRATRAGHIRDLSIGAEPSVQTAADAASPNGNTVSLEAEMVKAADVRQQHDMALAVYRSVSDILRASLGRR